MQIFKSIIVTCLFVSYSLTAFPQTIEQLNKLQEMKADKELLHKKRKKEAIIKAQRLGIPIRIESQDGKTMELMYFQNDIPYYYVTENATASATISTNKIQSGGSTGYDLTGDGEELGLWDAGRVLLTHQEFDGRVSNNDGSTFSLSTHSTHVAGTMIAQGQNSNAHGMANEANLLSHDWDEDQSEMISAAASGLMVSNHSYGFGRGWHYDGSYWYWFGSVAISETEDFLFGFYDEFAEDWDLIANNAPYYLIVVAAGNDRNNNHTGGHYVYNGTSWIYSTANRNADGNYDCLAHQSLSKNVLVVGAVNDISGGYSGSNDVVMSNFSSWGPTDDGRIKPDLVANGVTVYSSVATSNNSYGTTSGTSMATPSISGSVGLLLEHQRNLYGNTVYRSSTMKALLIHTADESGPNPGPDYMFGWGLANLSEAAQLMETDADQCLNIREYTLDQGSTIKIPIIKDNTKDLKVTICWNDPAANAISVASIDPPDKMLVNDLDLRVTSNGTTYTPWVLDKNNPANAATKGDNSVDNVEQVIIDNSYFGLCEITVSHKGFLQGGSQIVSVIISGNAPLDDNLNLNGITFSNDASYWVHDKIYSGNTTIQANANVNYIAGNSIILNTGFKANANSKFYAFVDEIASCNSGTFELKSNQNIPSGFVYERNLLPKTEIEDNNINSEISEEIEGSYILFPNPSSGIVYYESLKNSPQLVEISDISGKIIYANNSPKKNFVIDLSSNEPGLYIINLTFDNGIQTEKIILQ